MRQRTGILIISGIVVWLAMVMVMIAFGSVPPKQMANTIVTVTPSKTVLTPGETFTVAISIAPATGIAGSQFDLGFNPKALQIVSVAEGNLFKQGGANTYFLPGAFDNVNGTIKGVAGAILVDAAHPAPQSVSTAGNMAVITCKAVTAGQTSAFTLSNVIVGNPAGQSVPLASFSIIQTQVALPSDLNLDGIVNMADVLILVAAFGTAGTPPGNREDINADGVVNVLDLIILGQNFT